MLKGNQQDGEDEAVEEAVAAIKERRRQAEELAVDFVGKVTLQRMRNQSELFFKLQAYANEFFHLGRLAGFAEASARRCRNTNGPNWQRYEQMERNADRVKEHLALELIRAVLPPPTDRGNPDEPG